MNTPKYRLTVASALLAGSSLASAHGGDRVASTLFHHMTSPDHVVAFSLVAVAVLCAGIFSVCSSLRSSRQHKD